MSTLSIINFRLLFTIIIWVITKKRKVHQKGATFIYIYPRRAPLPPLFESVLFRRVERRSSLSFKYLLNLSSKLSLGTRRRFLFAGLALFAGGLSDFSLT